MTSDDCKHSSTWICKCGDCGTEFYHTPTTEDYDSVDVEQRAKRAAAITLIMEMDSHLSQLGVPDSIRSNHYEHMNTAAVQLGYIQQGDLPPWGERRGGPRL